MLMKMVYPCHDFCLRSTIKFMMLILIATVTGPFVVTSALVFKPPSEEQGEEDRTVIPWHPNWDKVTRCRPGERHSRFPECTCGHYASVIDDDSVYYHPLDELSETEGVHWKWKGKRKIYYICLPCSSCPDGVRMTGYCRQGQDTSCDPHLKCIDPSHVFDKRIKACGPPDTDELVPPQIEIHADESDFNGDGLKYDEHEHDTSTQSTQTAHAEEYSASTQSSATFSGIMQLSLIIVITFVGLEIVFVVVGILLYRKRTGRRHRTLLRVPSDLSQSSNGAQPLRCLSCVETRV